MKLKVFTLRFDESSGKFDDREIDAFVGDGEGAREVLDVSDHFFVHESRPTWAMLVTYRDAPLARPGERGPEPRRDWRAELDGPARELYDRLRSWRARAARREGLPPYLIVNNRQAAEIAAKRPTSVAGLREIHGLGDAKVSRWAEEILALVEAAGGGAGAAGRTAEAGGAEGGDAVMSDRSGLPAGKEVTDG